MASTVLSRITSPRSRRAIVLGDTSAFGSPDDDRELEDEHGGDINDEPQDDDEREPLDHHD